MTDCAYAAKVNEKEKIKMSDKTLFTPDEESYVTHDDVSVMRALLEQVKGLSFVSSAPALELAEADDNDLSFK